MDPGRSEGVRGMFLDTVSPNPALVRTRCARRTALLQGLPQIRNCRDAFSSSVFPDLIHGALLASCEKVEDCETTTGHVGQMARTLMKDARRGLNR